ncbi:iron-containing alcohol dehydrogenase [Pollutimonas harenae]|uniref:Iron-containing alcohol dehydrogenase n=1 Tax=Pollutimonas harenae TaxID=657015 RepID=A0A853GW96_9BURK|nr:iron-containing alcohol dehydrogenase [Pollutimonas harenae]NYT84412.1 iron-containing alcohol dehydrogenase [Pollutimonas harenae]TEA73187.1 iron-containing alcohol dehydrogenase [Pollutimonas harenae]
MECFGTIRAPRELIFGSGQRRSLGLVAKKLGRRALVVTDQRLAADADFRALIADLEISGLAVRIESGTLPDVPAESTVLVADAVRDFAPDLVIGVGGGSCLDMAKCVALLLSHGGCPQDYYGELKVPGPILPVLAIPTTAGTGSEVTPVAVLSDSQRSLKVGISSPYLIPTVALCDPELTLSCPASLTAIAGADALTHAIEAFTATRRPVTANLTQERVFIGKNALSDQFALAAISLLWQGLETACTQGSNLTARAQVMQGATFAGLAFGVAGTAAAHAIQYPAGALTHTAHGAGVACLMPWVMEWNRPMIGPELQQMAIAMQLANGDAVIPALTALFARIGIPPTLAALGLAEEQLDLVAEQSCGIERLIQNNPRPLDRNDMRKLLDAAFLGDASIIQ